MSAQQPQIFHSFDEVPSGARLVDGYTGALEEMFFIRNPQLKKNMPDVPVQVESFVKEASIAPIWVYYPEEHVVVHTVNEDDYLLLRTARNRNIITHEEQGMYRNATVGIAGLSVGSAVLNALVSSGGPKTLKIADFDTLEITNLNRLKATLLDIGKNKTDIAANAVWALDPFATLHLFDQGLTPETLESFLLEPRLDIFIDEMDSINLKILARLHCKKHKIPVLMATDNGNGVILDVERFDLEPDREIFHGLIGHMEESEVTNLDFKQWLQLATKIVGPEYLTERMQDSLLGIGKDIPSVPQLGTTASMAGAGMAFVVRTIMNKGAMPSGRYTYGLEQALIPEYNSPEQVAARTQKTQQFLERFGKRA